MILLGTKLVKSIIKVRMAIAYFYLNSCSFKRTMKILLQEIVTKSCKQE